LVFLLFLFPLLYKINFYLSLAFSLLFYSIILLIEKNIRNQLSFCFIFSMLS